MTAATKPKNEPIFNVPPVVLATVFVLIAIHVLLWLLGPEWQTWSLYAMSFIPSRFGGPEQPPFPQGAQYWSMFTYSLLHADGFHVASNCLWLLIFSTPLARRWNILQYGLFFVISAFCGALAMLFAHAGQFVVVVGASAVVSAALSAAVPIIFSPRFIWRSASNADYKTLKVASMTSLLTNPSALAFTAVFLAATLLSGASQMMTGTALLEERNIAWEAHLAGFAAGLVLFYTLDQWTVSSAKK